MKKYIFNIVLFSLFSLIPIATISILGDAAALFYKARFYSDLEENLKLTNIIEVTANHDERIFKKTLLEANAELKFDKVIFGSSRVMLVSSKHSLNLGVSGASLEDILALYQILVEQKITMDTILIGVDPWLFYNADSRWKSISKYYFDFKGSQEKGVVKHRLGQLLDPIYFQESLKNLVTNGINSPYIFHDEHPIHHSGTLIFPRGHIEYGEKYRNATKSEVEEKIDSYLSPRNHYKLNADVKLERDRIILFEDFISKLNAKGIVICAIFPSYHPQVYLDLNNRYKVIEQTEYIVREMDTFDCFYGSYNPEISGLNEDMFYDGMHLNETGVREILKKHTNTSGDIK